MPAKKFNRLTNIRRFIANTFQMASDRASARALIPSQWWPSPPMATLAGRRLPFKLRVTLPSPLRSTACFMRWSGSAGTKRKLRAGLLCGYSTAVFPIVWRGFGRALTTFKPHVQHAQRSVEETQSRNDDRRPTIQGSRYHPASAFHLRQFAGNMAAQPRSSGNLLGQRLIPLLWTSQVFDVFTGERRGPGAIRCFWQFFVNVRKVLIWWPFNIELPTSLPALEPHIWANATRGAVERRHRPESRQPFLTKKMDLPVSETETPGLRQCLSTGVSQRV